MKLASARMIWNPKKPEAKALAVKVAKFLSEKKIPVIGRESAPSILITIGGDGTLLYNKFASSAPIFAIGTQKSFICQSKGSDWRKQLGAIAKNGFKTEKRAMLACEINGKIAGEALNEIAVKSRSNRIMDVNIAWGGTQAGFRADGVLFSTPTGSSAYCYSCGGRQLPPLSKKYEIVGIAPHRRAFKPVAVSDSIPCKVWTSSKSADLIFDGQSALRLKPMLRVKIKKSKRPIRLVRI